MVNNWGDILHKISYKKGKNMTMLSPRIIVHPLKEVVMVVDLEYRYGKRLSKTTIIIRLLPYKKKRYQSISEIVARLINYRILNYPN